MKCLRESVSTDFRKILFLKNMWVCRAYNTSRNILLSKFPGRGGTPSPKFLVRESAWYPRLLSDENMIFHARCSTYTPKSIALLRPSLANSEMTFVCVNISEERISSRQFERPRKSWGRHCRSVSKYPSSITTHFQHQERIIKWLNSFFLKSCPTPQRVYNTNLISAKSGSNSCPLSGRHAPASVHTE